MFPFTGGSRFIQNGILTLRETAVFGALLMLTVIFAGLWLAHFSGLGLLTIGAFGMFIGWAYSAPPLKLNSRGIGEVCMWAGFALIAIGADYVQRRGFSMQPVTASASYALLVTNILYINQFPDRKADEVAAVPACPAPHSASYIGFQSHTQRSGDCHEEIACCSLRRVSPAGVGLRLLHRTTLVASVAHGQGEYVEHAGTHFARGDPHFAGIQPGHGRLSFPWLADLELAIVRSIIKTPAGSATPEAIRALHTTSWACRWQRACCIRFLVFCSHRLSLPPP